MNEQDESEVRKWIESSGLENVARIIDYLVSASGDTKAPSADTMLLRWIAHEVRAKPEKPLNAIVSDVVREFGAWRQPLVEDKSLIALLSRGFEEDRVRWLWFAEQADRPTAKQIRNEYARQRSKVERRVLTRLISSLPGAIDLFSHVKLDAKKRGVNMQQFARANKRSDIERRVVERLHTLNEGATATTLPRDFYDLAQASPSKTGKP